MTRKSTKSASREWAGPRPTPEAVRTPSLGFCVTPAECYRSRRSLVIWGMSAKAGFMVGRTFPSPPNMPCSRQFEAVNREDIT
jgi:hypothetical protein